MGRLIISVAIAAGALLAVPAWADREHRTDQKPTAGQISVQTMKRKINELGYEVRRIETEHGYFEAHLVEKQNGGAVKAQFDMTTGELVRAELRD